MEFIVGTPLLEVLNAFELNQTNEVFRTKIINFCKEELAHGDSVISNEIESAIINAWFNNSKEIVLPDITQKYSLSDSYRFEENSCIKIFEEYSDNNNGYYIRCITKDKLGNIIKCQLTYRSRRFKEFMIDGGVEDTLFDNNANGIADSRLIAKSHFNNEIKNVELYSDINLDGKFD